MQQLAHGGGLSIPVLLEDLDTFAGAAAARPCCTVLRRAVPLHWGARHMA